jgi:hypothetical protein
MVYSRPEDLGRCDSHGLSHGDKDSRDAGPREADGAQHGLCGRLSARLPAVRCRRTRLRPSDHPSARLEPPGVLGFPPPEP